MGPGVRDGRSLKLNTKIEGGLRNARGVKYTQRDTTATMTKPNPWHEYFTQLISLHYTAFFDSQLNISTEPVKSL